jgi:predicted DNA-binding transcriptional regulator AlpA
VHQFETIETRNYMAQLCRGEHCMPIVIEGVEYFTATDIHRELGVIRQTLWRWRKARKIPQGRRYRGREVVFTRKEVEAVRDYSNRLEPADATNRSR